MRFIRLSLLLTVSLFLSACQVIDELERKFSPEASSDGAAMGQGTSSGVDRTVREVELTSPWTGQANPLVFRYVYPIAPRVGGAPGGTSASEPTEPEGLSPRVRFERAPEGGAWLRLTGYEGMEAAQQDLMWCWAACAQMVNTYHGLTARYPFFADQEKIKQYFESLEELQETGAQFATIARAISPDLEIAMASQGPSAAASLLTSSTDDIVFALLGGEMAVVGIDHHAYVVTGVHFAGGDAAALKRHQDFLVDVAGFLGMLPAEQAHAIDLAVNATPVYEILAVELWDPWDGGRSDSKSVSELYADEATGSTGLQFVLSREVARRCFQPGKRTSDAVTSSLLGD